MRLDKLTTTFQQAIGGAQSIAVGNDNPSIEVSHVVVSLLEDHSGGSRSLIARSGGNTNNLIEEADTISLGTKNSITSFPERILISTAFLNFEVLNQ